MICLHAIKNSRLRIDDLKNASKKNFLISNTTNQNNNKAV